MPNEDVKTFFVSVAKDIKCRGVLYPDECEI
jgi:hypothetical protein